MGRARALDPSRSIDQFAHASWTLENGAPTDILTMAQTKDGYLWAGSSRGLYRFDGVSFEKVQGFRNLPGRSDGVSALLATPSGDLWIGHIWGGLSVYRDGKLQDVNPAPPHGAMMSIVQDPSGGIWAATNGVRHTALRHFHAGKWDIIEGGDMNLPEVLMTSMIAARDGAIWIAFEDHRVMRLPPEGGAFEQAPGVVGDNPSLAQATDGRIWITDTFGIRPLDIAPQGKPAPRNETKASFFADRDGALWAVNNDGGLLRIRHPDDFARGLEAHEANREREEDTARSHILSNASGAVIEDREGNIWVATIVGLDRFKVSNFVTQTKASIIPLINGTGRLVRTREGDVYSLWQDAANPLLFRDHYGALTTLKQIAAHAKTICAARDGGLWVLTAGQGFFHVKGDRVVATRAAPAAGRREPIYRNCAEDGAGRLWVAIQDVGLMRFDGGAWSRFEVRPDVKTTVPWLQEVDRQGRVLMYYGTRYLIRADGDKVETIFDQKQIPIRFIHAIYVVDDRVLLCGEGGLALYDGAGLRILDSSRFSFLDQVTGIGQTESGETWLLSSAGVVRLSSDELFKAFDRPGLQLQPRIFDFRDGLRGQSHFGESNAVAASLDGRVWFNTTGGLIWLDPTHLYRNDLPPDVLIRDVIVGNDKVAPQDHVLLAEGASNLHVDYTALSLTSPDRVMFRYRLTGVDAEWVEAGTRRQAFYTNLSPGTYRFQVIASNNDGIWNTTGAALDIEIPPTFLQSRWCLALAVLVFVAGLCLIYHLRLTQVAARLRLRMTARMEERERIARELHDTLLQGVQGLIFRFQAIAGQIGADQPARLQMELALDKADELLAEGRDRVVDLRAAEAARGLSTLLESSAARVLGGSDIEAVLATEGAPWEVSALIAEEIVRISDEFLFNTLQHAGARKAGILVQYGRRSLRVRFHDDGRGIDPSVLGRGGREGHFGLQGMRERADKIGARFALAGRPDGGAELTLTIPAAAAYLKSRRRWIAPLQKMRPL